MDRLRQEPTIDLVDELVRRMAPSGLAGRIEIEHDREQRAAKVWAHDGYDRSQLTRFDPVELASLGA